MAAIIHNLVTPFIKGLLGSIVFKRRNGKPYAAMKPIPSTLAPSASQLQVQQRFREAQHYARTVMADPVRRAVYEQAATAQGKSVFALAAGDFFSAPNISRINIDDYKGRVGDKIVITVLDAVAAASVNVLVRASNGAVLEQGAAAKDFEFWTYTATTAVAAGQNVTIEVTAKDRPGNSTTRSQPYHQP